MPDRRVGTLSPNNTSESDEHHPASAEAGCGTPTPTTPNDQHPVVLATVALMTRYLDRYPRPVTDYDADWPSPCEQGSFYLDDSGDAKIHWLPVPRWNTEAELSGWPQDFDGLEHALETPIHGDFKALFSHWSATLELTGAAGHVSLLQLWNRADVDRFVENLIGHVLVQRRARGPLTLFFACTDPDSEQILSIHNESGTIVLEEPGRPPLREVAPNLAQFLAGLEPAGLLTV
ncbi:MAG: SecY-interacting protein Syd [Pseudomonadota bacterium]